MIVRNGRVIYDVYFKSVIILFVIIVSGNEDKVVNFDSFYVDRKERNYLFFRIEFNLRYFG